jgi:lipoprotein signal peptidase
MQEKIPMPKPTGVRTRKVIYLAIGIVVFGILMAVRAEASEVWLRALIAGVAFGALGGSIAASMRK